MTLGMQKMNGWWQDQLMSHPMTRDVAAIHYRCGVRLLPTWAARRAQAVACVPSLPRRICQLYLSSRGTGTLLTLLRILPAILWQSGEQNQAPAQPTACAQRLMRGSASARHAWRSLRRTQDEALFAFAQHEMLPILTVLAGARLPQSPLLCQ